MLLLVYIALHPLKFCSNRFSFGCQSTVLRDVIKKGREWSNGLIPQMLELDHQLLLQFIVNDRDKKGTRLVGQEIAIVCSLEM